MASIQRPVNPKVRGYTRQIVENTGKALKTVLSQIILNTHIPKKLTTKGGIVFPNPFTYPEQHSKNTEKK